VLVNNLINTKNFFIFKYQPQEEAGSAGGQPASNKADGYTIEGGMVFIVPLFISIGILYGLKKLIDHFLFYHIGLTQDTIPF
jgi:hypothetical protein